MYFDISCCNIFPRGGTLQPENVSCILMITHLNLQKLFTGVSHLVSTKPYQLAERILGTVVLWTMVSVLGLVNISLVSEPFARRTGLSIPLQHLITLAKGLESETPRVLGIASDQAKDEKSTRSKRQSLENQYTYWQTVVSEHTQYRDGYLILASLSLALNQPNQLRFYVNKALQLDPNNPTALQLEKAIELQK